MARRRAGRRRKRDKKGVDVISACPDGTGDVSMALLRYTQGNLPHGGNLDHCLTQATAAAACSLQHRPPEVAMALWIRVCNHPIGELLASIHLYECVLFLSSTLWRRPVHLPKVVTTE